MTLMAQGRQWVVQKDASGDIRRAVAGNPSTGQAVEAGVDKSAGVGGAVFLGARERQRRALQVWIKQ
jgi:hypothetical protein